MLSTHSVLQPFAGAARPRPATTALFAGLTALVGCSTDDTRDVEWLGRREQIGAIEVVRNPAMPMLDSTRVSVERLWMTPAAGTEPASADSVWQDAGALAVADDTVFVLDRMAARVYAVRAGDGRWLATWGRKGRGPGELARPADIMMLGTTVGVLDGGKGTIERFGPDGTALDPIRLPGITFTARPLDSTRLVMAGMRDPEVFRIGGEATTLQFEPPVALPEGPPQACRRLGQVGDVIVRLSCIQPHIQMLDSLGRGIREITLALEPVQTDDTVLNRFTSEIRQMLASSSLSSAQIDQQVASTREAYRFHRRWRELRRDPADGMLALWEQTPDDFVRGPAAIHLLRESGEWLSTLRFPESWTAFALDDGIIYALARDPDTDVAQLVAYRLRIE